MALPLQQALPPARGQVLSPSFQTPGSGFVLRWAGCWPNPAAKSSGNKNELSTIDSGFALGIKDNVRCTQPHLDAQTELTNDTPEIIAPQPAQGRRRVAGGHGIVDPRDGGRAAAGTGDA